MNDGADDYAVYHRNRFDLAIHPIGVPMFVFGTVGALLAAINGARAVVAAGLLAAAVGLGIRGTGHRREPTPPEHFWGPGDGIGRIFSEQFYKFPKFLITGRRLAGCREPRNGLRSVYFG